MWLLASGNFSYYQLLIPEATRISGCYWAHNRSPTHYDLWVIGWGCPGLATQQWNKGMEMFRISMTIGHTYAPE